MTAAITQMARNLNGSKPLTDLGQAAEAYARRGWHVFPLSPRTKGTQLLPSWTREASNDIERVRQWWRRWPDANIGIACGPSRLLVVDLDGDEGRETWERLSNDHGIAPSPLVSVTGSGGRHLIYALPEGLRNTAKKLGPGIDTRANGGYIVAAPSIHPNGSAYAWADLTAEPAACPPELVDLLTREPDAWQRQRRTLADLRKPRDPMRWIVYGILPERGLVVLYGQPGGFKSAIAADIAGAVLAGRPWLSGPDGAGGQATTSGGVMWVNFDQGEHVLAERLEAMAAAWQLPDDAPLIAYSHPAPRLDAANADQIADLIKRGQGCALIVIDALTHIRGGADEREEAMAAVMDGLRALAEHTGACVLVLHHEKKSQGMGGRDGERMRGSSTIEAGADICLLVTRDGNRAKVKATKSRLSDVPEVAAQWSFEHKPGTKELASARFWPIDEVREAREELEAKILAELESTGGALSTRAIHKAMGGRWDATQEAVTRLHLARRVTVADGPRGAKLYALP